MRSATAIVADDLTGAADTGAGFFRAGLETVVTWHDVTPDLVSSAGAEVLAIDLRTRVMDAAGAAARTAAAIRTLRDAGVGTVYKKIDSMLRGHVGDELRAAADAWHEGSALLIAPAFPAMQRTTIGGVQRVGGKPLHNGRIAAILQFDDHQIGHLSLSKIRDASIAAALLAERGKRAIVCDAETDDDLRSLVRAGVGLEPAPLWVGSSGLAAALATVSSTECSRITGLRQRPGGPTAILIVVGSGSDAAREQRERVVQAGAASVPVSVASLNEEGMSDDGAMERIENHLGAGEDVVVSLSPTGPGNDPRIAARLGAKLSVLAPLIGGLVLTGGDTAAGVLDAWGIRSLRLAGEIEVGVPLSIGIGRGLLPVVTKAGTFGTADALVRARDRMRALLRPSRNAL